MFFKEFRTNDTGNMEFAVGDFIQKKFNIETYSQENDKLYMTMC